MLTVTARCPVCTWTLEVTVGDIDLLLIDAQDHLLECPARMSTFVDIS